MRSRGCKAKALRKRQLIFTHCLRQLAISIPLWGRESSEEIFEDVLAREKYGLRTDRSGTYQLMQMPEYALQWALHRIVIERQA